MSNTPPLLINLSLESDRDEKDVDMALVSAPYAENDMPYSAKYTPNNYTMKYTPKNT